MNTVRRALEAADARLRDLAVGQGDVDDVLRKIAAAIENLDASVPLSREPSRAVLNALVKELYNDHRGYDEACDFRVRRAYARLVELCNRSGRQQ